MSNATQFLVVALGLWVILGVLYITYAPDLERHKYQSLFLGGPIAWLLFAIFAVIVYAQEWKEKRNE